MSLPLPRLGHSFQLHSALKRYRALMLAFAAVRWPGRWASIARRAIHTVEPARVRHARAEPNQLLMDVSIISQRDAGTGIQRVVRSLLLELLRNPPDGFEVRPVRAGRKASYRYANEYLSSLDSSSSYGADTSIRLSAGDIFLGLDLSSRIVPSRQREFLAWRAEGVRFAFCVYDLLPALQPHWFTPPSAKSFVRWLNTLAVHADVLICISRSVAEDASTWLRRCCGVAGCEPAVRWFHLGSEFPKASGALHQLVPQLRGRSSGFARQSVLVVGTVEPRKGHAQLLDAFELLWEMGSEVTLVIAGREGWCVEALSQRLRCHLEAGKRLVWLADVSDAQLAALYANLGGLIMPSEAEGFGLPLVEAARYGMPLLVRDLPVFREVVGEHASYFSARTGADLAPQLAAWLDEIQRGGARRSDQLRCLSWADSADALKTLLADVAR